MGASLADGCFAGPLATGSPGSRMSAGLEEGWLPYTVCRQAPGLGRAICGCSRHLPAPRRHLGWSGCSDRGARSAAAHWSRKPSLSPASAAKTEASPTILCSAALSLMSFSSRSPPFSLFGSLFPCTPPLLPAAPTRSLSYQSLSSLFFSGSFTNSDLLLPTLPRSTQPLKKL